MEMTFTSSFQFYRIDKPVTTRTWEHFVGTFQRVIEERMPPDLPVEIADITQTDDNRMKITLNGKNQDDLIFTASSIKEVTGEARLAADIKPSMELWASLRSVGDVGFGLFCDAGIFDPVKEILLPLHTLRNQLAHDEKVPVRTIMTQYGFMNYFPLKLKMVNAGLLEDSSSVDAYRFEAMLTDSQIEQIRTWVEQDFEIIFTTGMPRQSVKRAVTKRGHDRDVIEIQRLGPLESAVVCKQGTRATGLIAHIGDLIPECRFTKLLPREIKKYWKS